MLIFHTTQKLLNTSRLKAPLYISEASEGQMLHSWYSTLLSTGFPGKMMVMYVHEPSLLTVVCRGKTIKGTWEEFTQRLPLLLKRFDFNFSFVETETALANDYVVSKTNSRSMLAHMNQLIVQLEFVCADYDSYENIQQDTLEESVMNYPYKPHSKSPGYITALEYWKDQKAIL